MEAIIDVITFAMDNWIVIGIVALVGIRIIKKAIRLTKRTLYLMYAMSGVLSSMGLMSDIVEFVLNHIQ